MTEKNKTILLVGGGTGGHIVPILSLSQEFEKRGSNINVITIGGNGPIDQKLYLGLKNHIALKTGKLHRSITLKNIIQLFLFFSGLISSLIILKKLKPSLIFSKAGYVSFPIIFWAKIIGIPYFIHESDIEMGASNKFAVKGAQKIFVGFPVKYYSKIQKEKLNYAGQILRPDISKPQIVRFDFGFNNRKPIIFVTGGSQGSTNINNAIFQILDKILLDYNVIHHTGSLDYDNAIEIRSRLTSDNKQSYYISPLLTTTANGIDSMRSAIFQSDLVISRASATTLAEVSMMKKPMIIVPYKYAASDHQTKNAVYYGENGAAVVISDDNLNGETLKQEIDNLFLDSHKMKKIGQKAFALQNPNGLSTIVEEIDKYLNN